MAEKDPRMVRLGGRIRELREAAGLSRERLGEAAGVSVRAVVQWELGEREPGWFNMLALAGALGVDCTAFTRPPAERPPAGPGRPRKGPAAWPAAEGEVTDGPEQPPSTRVFKVWGDRPTRPGPRRTDDFALGNWTYTQSRK